VTVDAALLSLQHSVSINPADLPNSCQVFCHRLFFYGAMVAAYRGIFGEYYNDSGILGRGFWKYFDYDSRLYHNSPPWMLSGQAGDWEATSSALNRADCVGSLLT
jgi:hypothetical protein